MHECATGIGAKFAVWSGVGDGTEVDLTVPALIGYGKRRVVPVYGVSGGGRMKS
jgi:hypothetical protein